MTPSRITKSGKVVWRVYIGQIDGKKRYKQFSTRAKAEKFIREEKIRKNRQGEMACRAAPEDVAEYLELSAKLKSQDATVREAVEFYLDHLIKTRNATLLPNAIQQYLDEVKKKLAPTTVAGYRKRLNQFAKPRPKLRVDQIVDDIRPYLEKGLKKYSRQTVENDRRVLSSFFTWAIDRHMVASNPCLKVKSFLSKKKGKAKVFLPQEVKLILSKLEENFDTEIATFVVVSLFGGVRPLEFRKKITKHGKQVPVALDWESIDITKGEVAISEDLSKTNLYRTVQNETLQTWLQWIEEKSTEKLTGEVFGYLFRYKWQDWRKEHVPNLEFSPDILRHTFGTYRLKTLQSAGSVALEMGNSESIVIRHYLDARRPLEDAEMFWSFMPNKKTKVA